MCQSSFYGVLKYWISTVSIVQKGNRRLQTKVRIFINLEKENQKEKGNKDTFKKVGYIDNLLMVIET